MLSMCSISAEELLLSATITAAAHHRQDVQAIDIIDFLLALQTCHDDEC